MKENSFNTFLLIKSEGERRACGVSENSNMSLLTANSSSMYKYIYVQMLLFVVFCLSVYQVKKIFGNCLLTAC